MVKEELTHERIDNFRHQILAACTTAKTCAQIANIIGGTNEKVYSQAHALVKLDNLIKTITSSDTNPRIVQFKTINIHYNRAEQPKQRLRETEPPQVGHFHHRIENFEKQHRATAKLTRENYRSARASVGISEVYNG